MPSGLLSYLPDESRQGAILPNLVGWLEDAPPERRAGAADALARAYLHAEVADDRREEMEAAMTLLLDDPAPEVRFSLADALAESPAAPRHIILSLATDHLETAELVLASSPVFTDEELVDLAAETCDLLQLVIASRQTLSASVCAAIAEVGCLAACQALLENRGADITGLGLKRIAERFASDSGIADSLASRPGLPPDVRQMLARQRSLELLPIITGREGTVADFARDACDQATVAIASNLAMEDLLPFIEHLRTSEQLTASLVLRAVSAGNVPFFEATLAVLARVPLARVNSLVRTRRLAGLKAVYRRAGLPMGAFEAFWVALDVWRGLDPSAGAAERFRFVRSLVDDVLARYQSVTEGEMGQLASMLRRFAAEAARLAARDLASTSVAQLPALRSAA
jgi:uncharacterized protein (DUF2336 family)